MQQQGKTKRISGLWVNEMSDGTKYFSSPPQKDENLLVMLPVGEKFMIFKNKFKDKPNSPEYVLMMTEGSQQEQQVNDSDDDLDDDIPF